MLGILFDTINKYLSIFFSNFSQDNLRLGLLKGEVELKDLEINQDVLQNLMYIPPMVLVRRIHISAVRAKVPITSLGSEPIVAYVERIDVIAEEPPPNFVPIPPSAGLKKLLDLIKKKQAEPAKKPDAGKRYGLGERIGDGIRIELGALHLSWTTLKRQSLSVDLQHLSVYATNSRWQVVPLKDAHKHVKLKGGSEIHVFKECALQSVSVVLRLPHTDGTVENIAIVQGIPVKTHMTLKRKSRGLALAGIDVDVHMERNLRLVIPRRHLSMLYQFVFSLPIFAAAAVMQQDKAGAAQATRGDLLVEESAKTSPLDLIRALGELSFKLRLSSFTLELLDEVDGEEHAICVDGAGLLIGSNARVVPMPRSAERKMVVPPKPRASFLSWGHGPGGDGAKAALGMREQAEHMLEAGGRFALVALTLTERWPRRGPKGQTRLLVSIAHPTPEDEAAGAAAAARVPPSEAGDLASEAGDADDGKLYDVADTAFGAGYTAQQNQLKPLMDVKALFRYPAPPEPLPILVADMTFRHIEVLVETGWIMRAVNMLMESFELTFEKIKLLLNEVWKAWMGLHRIPCFSVKLAVSDVHLVVPIPAVLAEHVHACEMELPCATMDAGEAGLTSTAESGLRDSLRMVVGSFSCEIDPQLITKGTAPRAASLHDRVRTIERELRPEEGVDLAAGEIREPVYTQTQRVKAHLGSMQVGTQFGTNATWMPFLEVNGVFIEADCHCLDYQALQDPVVCPPATVVPGPEVLILTQEVNIMFRTHQYILLRTCIEVGWQFLERAWEEADRAASEGPPKPAPAAEKPAVGPLQWLGEHLATTLHGQPLALLFMLEMEQCKIELISDREINRRNPSVLELYTRGFAFEWQQVAKTTCVNAVVSGCRIEVPSATGGAPAELFSNARPRQAPLPTLTAVSTSTRLMDPGEAAAADAQGRLARAASHDAGFVGLGPGSFGSADIEPLMVVHFEQGLDSLRRSSRPPIAGSATHLWEAPVGTSPGHTRKVTMDGTGPQTMAVPHRTASVAEQIRAAAGSASPPKRTLRMRVAGPKLSANAEKLVQVSRLFLSGCNVMFPSLQGKVMTLLNRTLSAGQEEYRQQTYVQPVAPLMGWSMEVLGSETMIPDLRHDPPKLFVIEVDKVAVAGVAHPLNIVQDIAITGTHLVLYTGEADAGNSPARQAAKPTAQKGAGLRRTVSVVMDMARSGSKGLARQPLGAPMDVQLQMTHEWVGASWLTKMRMAPMGMDLAASTSQLFFLVDIIRSQLSHLFRASSGPAMVAGDGKDLVAQLEAIWRQLSDGLAHIETVLSSPDAAPDGPGPALPRASSIAPALPRAASVRRIPPNFREAQAAQQQAALARAGAGAGPAPSLPPLKEGYIRLKGSSAFAGWKRRFAVLRPPHHLQLFQTSASGQGRVRLVKTVDLEGSSTARAEERAQRPGVYLFRVTLQRGGAQKTKSVRVDNRLDMDEWIAAFQTASTYARTRPSIVAAAFPRATLGAKEGAGTGAGAPLESVLSVRTLASDPRKVAEIKQCVGMAQRLLGEAKASQEAFMRDFAAMRAQLEKADEVREQALEKVKRERAVLLEKLRQREEEADAMRAERDEERTVREEAARDVRELEELLSQMRDREVALVMERAELTERLGGAPADHPRPAAPPRLPPRSNGGPGLRHGGGWGGVAPAAPPSVHDSITSVPDSVTDMPAAREGGQRGTRTVGVNGGYFGGHEQQQAAHAGQHDDGFWERVMSGSEAPQYAPGHGHARPPLASGAGVGATPSVYGTASNGRGPRPHGVRLL
eukprot:tig00021537_g22289.t1